MFVIGTRPRRWAIAALMALACGPKVKPGLKVTGAELEAKFDRGMVASEALGREVKDAPMRITPSVPGRMRWLDARTLAFTPDQPLPGSTRFQLEVKAGTVALDGLGIDKPVKWSFETERLAVEFPGAPQKWATPDQAIAVAFNQPVKAREVEKRCGYASDVGKVAAVVDSTGETEEARRKFRVIPHEALALATGWRFTCARELTGSEGPLPMDPAAKNEVAFETYGAFKVVDVAPHGSQISPDEAAIVIRLSNPLPAASAPLPLKLEPAVEGFPERAVVSGDRISMSLRALLPNTAYTIKIDASLADKFGQRLAGEHVAGFGTGDGTPRLDIETGAWVVESGREGYLGWTRNLTKLEVDVAAVPEAKLSALSSQLDWWDESAVDLRGLGLRGVHKTIPIKGRQNHWHQIAIEPAKLLGGSAASTGFYYVALRAPEEPRAGEGVAAGLAAPAPSRELLLNFTNLGVTAKLAGPSGLVWVTRLDNGQPQPGAEVTIRDGAGKVRWRGKTGDDGVAVTPGTSTLAPKSAPVAARRDGELGDGEGGGEGGGEEGDFGDRRPTQMLVFARVGSDVTWINPSRAGGLAAWNFHVPIDESPRAVQLRGFLHTDRGLYRPGETVHVRGLARTMKLGGALRVPGSRKVHVTVRDPRGEELLAKNVVLSRYGGFSLNVPIGEGARLGDYRVEAALADGSFSERFSVEQYRTAAFEVKIPNPAREPVAGEEIKLTAEARYLYGAPLRGGAITWRVYRRGRVVSFPKLAGFEFGDARSWYEDWHSRSAVSEPLVNEEAQKLDKDGRAKLSLRLPKQDFQAAQDLMVTAEVQDETHQTIAANVAIPAHRAGIYFGVDRGSPIAGAGGARAVKVVAVDTKGERIVGSPGTELEFAL